MLWGLVHPTPPEPNLPFLRWRRFLARWQAGQASVAIARSHDERGFLEAQLRMHKAARSLPGRCRIVLSGADGLTSKEMAAELGHSEHMAGKWRRRFSEQRIEGLSDEYRAGHPRTISDERIADVIKRVQETAPQEATQWSIRSMAAELGLSHTRIPRIRNAFGLQPHRTETFKLSTGPLFVDKIQDVLGLYMSPPNRAIMLCIDEKPQIQALDRDQPILRMTPGMAERRTHTYTRNGTTSPLAALDIATGTVIGKCYKRLRALEILDILKEFARRMPEGRYVHVVMENCAPHKTPRAKATNEILTPVKRVCNKTPAGTSDSGE